MSTRDVWFASLLMMATAGVWGESVSPVPIPQPARNLNNLGSTYFDRGEYGRAESVFSQSAAMGEPEELFQQALRVDAEKLGPVHPRVGTYLNNQER